ncbi:MAG TPA: hypothetical protein VG347_11640 [Verrucomicrobiae bacterium]|nr:hypothetical protein [Verrucomicrobiae bacterium]
MDSGKEQDSHWMHKYLVKIEAKRDEWQKGKKHYLIFTLGFLALAAYIVKYCCDKLLDSIWPHLPWAGIWRCLANIFYIAFAVAICVFVFWLDFRRSKKKNISMSVEPWIFIAILLIIIVFQRYNPHPNKSGQMVMPYTSYSEVLTGKNLNSFIPFTNYIAYTPDPADNPTNITSVELGGKESVMEFYNINQSRPLNLCREALDQHFQNHPLTGIFLYENAEKWADWSGDINQTSWRQYRPNYALLLFKVGRNEDAVNQLNKMIEDIKSATNAPGSPWSTPIIEHKIINDTLSDWFSNLRKWVITDKPTVKQLIAPIITKYEVLQQAIESNDNSSLQK